MDLQNCNCEKASLKNVVEVRATKKSIISGIIVFIVLVLAYLGYVFSRGFKEFVIDYYLFASVFVIQLLISLAIIFKFKTKSKWLGNVTKISALFILPCLILVMSEIANGIFQRNFTSLIFWGGYILILTLTFLFTAISGSIRFSLIFVSSVVAGLSIANNYVLRFRGTPFLPTDFYAAKTATNVAMNYNFSPNLEIIAAVCLLVLIIVLALKIKKPDFSLFWKCIFRGSTGVVCIVMAVLFFTTNTFAKIGIIPNFWDQSVSNNNQGFLLNFTNNTKYMYVTAPLGYSAGEIDEIVENAGKVEAASKNQTPNIICIMNEALCDLRVLGDFETNQEYMPFLNSLTENTIKGNLYNSVIGGGTCNTEFEFLTGHTMAFLPSGSYPYMSNLNSPVSSIVSTLKSQGYSSVAFHPYYASGWERTKAYSNFVFDDFISIEDILDDELMDAYKQFANGAWANYLNYLMELEYPEKSDMFSRFYISDEYNYGEIIKNFENRDTSSPYFMFNVTIQNHGGYTDPNDYLEEDVQITSLSNEYDDVSRYLSLLKDSDEAFADLIAYFESIEEPTVICMFGDHQPALDAKFYSEMLDKGSMPLYEWEQKRYVTPFYIWANFDIEEQYVEKLSTNYLSSLLLKTAGVELTEYNRYLLKLSEALPIIDKVGYVDNKGNYYHWDDESEYTQILNDYKCVQYNNLLDQKNVDQNVFYLNGYVPKSTDLEMP